MTPNNWAFSDARFNMPPHWLEWLGTIRTEEVEHSNLFLLSKALSQVPEVVDAETAELKRYAGHFYGGLLLGSSFAPTHKPVMLAGYRRDGEINVRSQDDYDCAIPSIVRHYPPVTLTELQLAAKIASRSVATRRPRNVRQNPAATAEQKCSLCDQWLKGTAAKRCLPGPRASDRG
jgi:hypothetical protein